MKVLVTGVNGFVGSHMADYLIENDLAEVHGLTRWRSNLEFVNDKVTLHHGDLRDLNSLILIMERVKPDCCFHFAAQSYVTTSFTAPADTMENNILGTLNLLSAVRHAGINPKIVIASSSEVYGQVEADEVPIKETNQFRPASPYAVSKVAEDMLGLQYYLSYGMRIVRTRLFTHTGPRRGDVFVESAFAKQIAEIEAGKAEEMYVGNLNSVRTFMDVRDAVRAYWMALDCPNGEVYNIGGDRTMSIREMMCILKSFSDKKIEHVMCDTLLRPSDVTLQIPDTTKFRDATGWSPRIPLEKTLEDLLNYQRGRV